MQDLTILKGRVGPPQQHHLAGLADVTYSRFSAVKTKPATTFINSPLTDAQIELMYTIEDVGGTPMGMVTIQIPTASATMGHNYMHAGLDSICWEMACTRGLCQVVLAVLGFTPEEVSCFVEEATVEFAELTWHTPTASTKALNSLQARVKEIFDAQQRSSGRHDVGVSDVDYWESNGSPCLLGTFKNGDCIRHYGKINQITSRRKRDKRRNRMSPEVRQHLPQIVDAIKYHARTEFLFCAATLKEFGLAKPRDWTPEAVKALIDARWKYAGLDVQAEPPDLSRLSPKVAETLTRYLAKENPRDFLSAYSLTRHRAAIRKATGVDIDDRHKRNKARPQSVGYQLQYDRRWEPKGPLRELVLCEVTAPGIVKELKHGLAFLQTGETPAELINAEERSRWLKRWELFARRESGRHVLPHAGNDVEPLPNDSQGVSTKWWGGGIGNAPVDPDAEEDQLMFIDGEWQVR